MCVYVYGLTHAFRAHKEQESPGKPRVPKGGSGKDFTARETEAEAAQGPTVN